MEDLETLLGKAAPSTGQLSDIETLCRRAFELQGEIEMLQAAATKTREELNGILLKTLPDMIAGAGLKSFTLSDGKKIEIKDYVSGSLPKDPEAHERALVWIRNNDGDALIKTHVHAEFRKGEGNLAGEALELLRNLGVEFSAKETIHHSTLVSYAKERMRKGKDVPMETLGLVAGRMAKIPEASQ